MIQYIFGKSAIWVCYVLLPNELVGHTINLLNSNSIFIADEAFDGISVLTLCWLYACNAIAHDNHDEFNENFVKRGKK